MTRNFHTRNNSCKQGYRNKFCPVCRDAGRDPHAHALRENGIITCPYLRSIVCCECGATGDHAHTLKHCPMYQKRIAMEIANQKKKDVEDSRLRHEARKSLASTKGPSDSQKIFPQQPFSTLTFGNVRSLASKCEIALVSGQNLIENFKKNFSNRSKKWSTVAATPRIEEKNEVVDEFAVERKMVYLSSSKKKKSTESWDSDEEMDFSEELVWEQPHKPLQVSSTSTA